MTSQPWDGPENTSPGTARNRALRAVADNLPGLVVAGLTGDEDESGRPEDGKGAVSADCRVRAYPYPSETRDRRLYAILRPVEYSRSHILLRTDHLPDSEARFPLFDSRRSDQAPTFRGRLSRAVRSCTSSVC